MDIANVGYKLILISGLAGALALVLSWLWHALDHNTGDPQDDWDGKRWAKYEWRAKILRFLRGAGLAVMYASLVGAVMGSAIVWRFGAP